MISVIIPCYNYGKYLAETIESVLVQSYRDFEIIVVNDGSTDNSLEVACHFPTVKILNQENAGLSAARNNGITVAQGDLIFPLDADDLLMEDCLKRCVDRMNKTGRDIVCPGLQEFEEKKNFQFSGGNFTLEGFKKANQIHASSLYRKKMWEKLGGYDESMREGYEDWDFWLRAVNDGYRVSAIEEPLFLYRIHSDSMVHKTHAKHDEIRQYMLNKLNNKV